MHLYREELKYGEEKSGAAAMIAAACRNLSVRNAKLFAGVYCSSLNCFLVIQAEGEALELGPHSRFCWCFLTGNKCTKLAGVFSPFFE